MYYNNNPYEHARSFSEIADMADYDSLCDLRSLARFFNRQGTPYDCVKMPKLPEYIIEVSVARDGAFDGEKEGNTLFICPKYEPCRYLYFCEDDYGAFYAKTARCNYTEDDYKVVK